MDGLKNKYLVKRGTDNGFTDITTLFDGVRILSVTGMNSRGKAVNIYNEQWDNSQVEDFLIADENSQVVYANTDIVVTFIVGEKYAGDGVGIDVSEQHDDFIDYMTGSDVYIKSEYTGKTSHCVFLNDYEPTTIKLQRNGTSYILGELTLHQLDLPTRNS